MALLVRSDLEIVQGDVRTFQLLKWDAMPDARIPDGREASTTWYDEDEAEALRLSSKSHWDVPVRLPDGRVLHILASHPTPPAFDGAEQRNVRRNHDEIRLWRDYLNGASYIVDDTGVRGGLGADPRVRDRRRPECRSRRRGGTRGHQRPVGPPACPSDTGATG